MLSKKIIYRIVSICLVFSCMMLPKMSHYEVGVVRAEEIWVERKADVIFLIDATGSMGSFISDVKKNIGSFISLLDEEEVDVRVRFVVFQDITNGEETVSSSWLSDVSEMTAYLQNITIGDGGDYAETPLDAYGLMLDSSFGFRDDASGFCILLTDAGPKLDNNYGYISRTQIAEELENRKINSSVITQTGEYDNYRNLVSEAEPLSGMAAGILADIGGDYSVLLKKLVKDVIVPTIEGITTEKMYPTTGEEGIATKVKVRASGMNYASDFAVTVGGKKVEVYQKEKNYFRFKVPIDLPVGTYEVIVINGGGAQKKVGEFTYTPKPVPTMPAITEITPDSGEEGVANMIKVRVKGFDYTGMSVTIGGVEAEVQNQGSTYFRIKAPTTLPVGTYDIVVNSTYGTQTIGKYTYTPKPVPTMPAITEITPDSGEEGVANMIKVRVKGFDYTGMSVTIGGVEAEVQNQGSTYFRIKAPTTLPAGTYDIVVNSTYGTQTIGKYTYTAKPVPIMPTITNITPTIGYAGDTNKVKVVVKNFDYTGMTVTVGGQPAEITNKTKNYFRFKVPQTLGVGTYDIVIHSVYGEYTIGTFTCD